MSAELNLKKIVKIELERHELMVIHSALSICLFGSQEEELKYIQNLLSKINDALIEKKEEN